MANSGHSLLTRIRKPEFAGARRGASASEVRDSLLSHLRAMCQTRQGTMLTCPQYGVAAISEMVHAFPDAIDEMARTIKHTIQAYEPRLTDVTVRQVPSEDLTLRYTITARLRDDRSGQRVQFETSVDASQRLTIR